jgi:DNA-binding MarR family transcriptional regulator
MPRAKKAPTTAAPDVAAAVIPAETQPPLTKSASVLAHLRREHGATLAELVVATGWQPHTTRAVLTGLRKKGHAIERRKRDDVSCYHLPVANA